MENIIKNIRGLIKDTSSTVRNVFEYDTDASFKLSEPRIKASSIKVYKNGEAVNSSDFSYNDETNKVTITATLTKGDMITIVFECYEKYSDAEISSYIESNLVRFTQKRYKKTFVVNESDEIVDEDGEEPTISEQNVIAIITAIDIDPQNVEIRTRDFTVTATENKSKSDQINEVFAQFDRGFISLDYFQFDE